MECNKEEAVRARDLAEKKLVEKNFKIAQKMALKAQSLFPDLENINQLLTVCSVHCSSIDKINGETDWYAVLQVAISADDLAIKKQYRKLALLLHPDKNKFPGAESAFKLVGEANMILSDKGKRSLHDMKRRGNGRAGNFVQNRRPAAQQPPQPVRTAQTGQAAPAGQTGQTFWTICHWCGMKYQYYRTIYKKALRCQNCLKAFIAYDINEQTTGASNPNPYMHARFNSANGPATDPLRNFPSPFQFQPGAGSSTANGTAAAATPFEKVNLEKVQPSARPSPAGGTSANKPKPPTKRTKPQKKKRKRVIEDDESEVDSSESEEDEIVVEKVKVNLNGGPPRRSTRQKHDVKYNEKNKVDEDLDDDLNDYSDDNDDDEEEDKTIPRKRLRKESDKENNQVEEEEDEMKVEEEKDEPDSGPNQFMYQDPEFFQFDTLRCKTRFAPDQAWAAYDDRGGMPRFYAIIKKVQTKPKFKLHYVWLEPAPLLRSSVAWTRAALPVATGVYKTGDSAQTEELLMFSHEMEYSRGSSSKKPSFEIYPKKGEVWAIFKNWDLNWCTNPNAHKGDGFEFVMVEILSDFKEQSGIMVINLVKIKGFVSLFMHGKEAMPYFVPVSEMLKFSHRVPLYHTKGDEKDGVPVGAFDLDTASLPADLDRAFDSVNLGELNSKSKPNLNSNIRNLNESLNDKSNGNFEEKGLNGLEDQMGESSGDTSQMTNDFETEFYNFTNDRTIEKFEPGQIWALYSDVDMFPKYYASVKRVELLEKVLHIKWLEAVSEGLGEEKRWVDADLPIGCGLFKLSGSTVKYDSIDAFSHVVNVVGVVGKRNRYEIFPAKDEIWALYRNWTVGWNLEDIKEKCQYNLVLINKKRKSGGIKVSILSKVDGYKAVFNTDRLRKEMVIPREEFLRFSHKIPSYRLEDEKGGTLRGCFELDPQSLPENLLW